MANCCATLVIVKDKRFNPAQAIALMPPDDTVVNEQIQEQIVNITDGDGQMRFFEASVDQKQPIVTMNFPKWTRQLMLLKWGYPGETEAITDALYSKFIRIEKNEYSGATEPGQEGYGMAADQDTSEFVVFGGDGDTVQLVRQNWAGFNSATPNTFAQGQHGAIKVSNNLVTSRAWGFPMFLYPATADVLSHEPFTEFSLDILGVITEDYIKKVWQLTYPSAQLNRQDNSEKNFKQVPVPLSFRTTDLSCRPKFRFLNVTRTC